MVAGRPVLGRHPSYMVNHAYDGYDAIVNNWNSIYQLNYVRVYVYRYKIFASDDFTMITIIAIKVIRIYDSIFKIHYIKDTQPQ